MVVAKCFSCGKSAMEKVFFGEKWYDVCLGCNIELNLIGMKWFHKDGWGKEASEYNQRKLKEYNESKPE